MAQVNYFDCGGMAIGFVFSHRAADGVTMASFIRSWSLYASGGCTESVCPSYSFHHIFPHNEAMKTESHGISCFMRLMKIGKTKMRRYVFDSRAISTLKSKSGDISRLSKAEVVTAFLWQCFIFASKPAGKLSLISQAVNLRRRTQPPFPENYFGNFLWLAAETCEQDENVELENLVRKLRQSLTIFDDEFVMRMHGDDGLSGFYENVGETWGKYPESAEFLHVTSWCNFGVNKVDFGWGNPIWINNCCGSNESESPYINTIWLIDSTKNGDGVEAWVTLDEHYIKTFDDIEELLVLASIDPNPFDI